MVRDKEGRPLAGETIRLSGEVRSIQGSFEGASESDADGRFAFEGLPVGSYHVARAVEDRLIPAFRLFIPMKEAETHDVVLRPEVGSASIEGVLEGNGPLLDELPVWLVRMPASSPNPSSRTGVPLPSWGVIAREGRFLLEGVPAGRYAIQVAHRDEDTNAMFNGQGEAEATAGSPGEVWIWVSVR